MIDESIHFITIILIYLSDLTSLRCDKSWWSVIAGRFVFILTHKISITKFFKVLVILPEIFSLTLGLKASDLVQNSQICLILVSTELILDIFQ